VRKAAFPPAYLQVSVAVPVPLSPPEYWLAVIVTGAVVAPTQLAVTVIPPRGVGEVASCTFTASEDFHVTEETRLL